jgi:hypothetical protein
MMGVESYLMRLRGNQSDLDEVVSYSSRMFGITPDLDQSALSSAYSHYVYRDDLHVIEFEFFQATGYYEVSIRFALCSPTSVDQVFIAHVLALMRNFTLIATICEELPEREPRDYNKEDAGRFIANCSWSIARSRTYWQQMFGTEEAGLSVSDALRKFVLGESLSR